MTPEDVGSGVISGSWEYVVAAYVITWLLLGGYSVSLWWRGRQGAKQ